MFEINGLFLELHITQLHNMAEHNLILVKLLPKKECRAIESIENISVKREGKTFYQLCILSECFTDTRK